jgi:hypothetical protein
MFYHPLLWTLPTLIGATAVLLILSPEFALIWSVVFLVVTAVVVLLNTGSTWLLPQNGSEPSPIPSNKLESKQDELGFEELSPGESPIVE